MPPKIPDDLVPPLQNPPGATLDAEGQQTAFYQFVTIQRTEDSQLKIWTSVPAYKSPALSGETYVEEVVQTYAVQVPYTELVDGKEFTKLRTEHRTRTVPITKYLPKSDTPKEDLIKETYTVSVPYTERLDGGASVTRRRLESRTRMVDPNEVRNELTTLTDFVLEPLDNVVFYDLTGNRVNQNNIFEDCDSAIAAIQLADAEHIVDYFSHLLAVDAVCFVVFLSDTRGESG